MSNIALQPTNIAPSTVEYGGDEISALVLDPGSCWTRSGFAGEDAPKSVIPTDYGVIPDGKFHFGDNDVHAPRAGMEIKNPMNDGIVADWDIAPQLWKYAVTKRLTANLDEHPLLMTEPAWNPPKNREKTLEIVFEEYNVPAFYLAKSGVCSAFALGKATALVIDMGAANVSVTPVHDGLVLRKGVTKSPLAGNFLTSQIRTYLSNHDITITPHYLVASKTPVEVNCPAKATYRTFPTDSAPTTSYRIFQETRVIHEMKETVFQAWSAQIGPFSDTLAMQQNPLPKPFEFPDGFNITVGVDRYKVVESLFNTSYIQPDPTFQPPLDDPNNPVLSIPQLIANSLNNVDIELRPILLNNVIVTGGSSLLYGFTDRINMELSQMFPGPRVRLTAPGNTVERRYGSWLGGSILASLGTFHQLWISKKEYEENGAVIVEKRCK